MPVPDCPQCGEPVTRILDLAYGYWEWDDEKGTYGHRTCSDRVDVAPWVHDSCMGELRDLHPQNDYSGTPA
ncbi:MAG: hypothetical protein GY929_24725 [Actinomycetia bacterium]|nr:hypothetical protein [Actinomycetes bacterium]